jgi:SAM-dependent methyltransferase
MVPPRGGDKKATFTGKGVRCRGACAPYTAVVKRHAPATARNRNPIRGVLERALPPAGAVLEVACGTGEHAVAFARAFPALAWQPSDPDPEALASARAWVAEASLPNLLPPVELDVEAEPWPVTAADAVVCINMIHIAPWSACEALLAGAARLLAPRAPLFLYGPYFVRDRPTAPSNEAFDQSLRLRDPSWGIRWLHEVEAAAASHGLALEETVEMPANNLSVIFRRQEP